MFKIEYVKQYFHIKRFKYDSRFHFKQQRNMGIENLNNLHQIFIP